MTTCSPGSYTHVLADSLSPFTDTAAGAFAAYTIACDVPPSGSLRNRRYVRLSVLAERISPLVPVRYMRADARRGARHAERQRGALAGKRLTGNELSWDTPSRSPG